MSGDVQQRTAEEESFSNWETGEETVAVKRQRIDSVNEDKDSNNADEASGDDADMSSSSEVEPCVVVCRRSVCSTDPRPCDCPACHGEANDHSDTGGDAAPVCEPMLPSSRVGERKRQAHSKAVAEANTRRRVILDEEQAVTPAQKMLAKQLARVRALATGSSSSDSVLCGSCGHPARSTLCCQSQ